MLPPTPLLLLQHFLSSILTALVPTESSIPLHLPNSPAVFIHAVWISVIHERTEVERENPVENCVSHDLFEV